MKAVRVYKGDIIFLDKGFFVTAIASWMKLSSIII